MKNKICKKTLSLLLAAVLIVAMAFSFTACNDVKTDTEIISEEVSAEISVESEENSRPSPTPVAESFEESVDLVLEETESTETSLPEESEEVSSSSSSNVLGEGEKSFSLIVSDYEGNETTYTVNTDMEMVGDALKELGIIEGEEGAYGLYVKKVMGIRADYDLDGKYWAFYIDGDYAVSGIDSTEIKSGANYELRVQ